MKIDSSISRVVITDVLIGGSGSYSYGRNYEVLNTVFLKDYQTHHLGILYTVKGKEFISGDSLEFSWKLEGDNSDWSMRPTIFQDGTARGEFFDSLNPGNYTFIARVRRRGKLWRKPEAKLIITVSLPFWQQWWFWASVIAAVSLVIYTVFKLRSRGLRKQELLKVKYEKEALELEAWALRAQMNPHFIFNCLNSIKSLMQKNDQDNAVIYLTTFSKLIRTIFQNSGSREITLNDELETCKLYIQLEGMRFGNKFRYVFKLDENVDLKSIKVPALIVQPFIENAIWHGIMPSENGGTVIVSVEQKENDICCTIDDDGVGREVSRQNKSRTELSAHISKGIHLTQARLSLDNTLNKRNAIIETFDKKDSAGRSLGTKVVLTFKEY